LLFDVKWNTLNSKKLTGPRKKNMRGKRIGTRIF